jgi:very-short-patch-repair endonuclease
MSRPLTVVREAAKHISRAQVGRRLQKEAAARPESTQVQTAKGLVWMSPIESRLYEAMKAEGLSPTAQFCVEGYFVDFAFPDIRLAVEADGGAYHTGEARERDRKRDWILKNAGWSVKRFHGTTIYNKAGNCAFVIRREVEAARAQDARLAAEAQHRRQARRDAVLRPFQWLVRFLWRKAGNGAKCPKVDRSP